jgi:hypothetical protein
MWTAHKNMVRVLFLHSTNLISSYSNHVSSNKVLLRDLRNSKAQLLNNILQTALGTVELERIKRYYVTANYASRRRSLNNKRLCHWIALLIHQLANSSVVSQKHIGIFTLKYCRNSHFLRHLACEYTSYRRRKQQLKYTSP